MGSQDDLFTVYWITLVVSGILMLVIAGTGFGSPSVGERTANVIFGVGFLGYGLYLGFIFDGGSYWIFFKAFIVPVLLIANAIRGAVKRRQQTPQPPAMQGYPAQPYPPLQDPTAPAPSQAYLTPQANGITTPYTAQQGPVAPTQPINQSPIQPG